VDPGSLSRKTSAQKVPFMLRLLDARQLSARGAASLLEINRTLSTWPQVSGDVAAGAPAIAEAVRRIGLGEHLPSGRARLDVSGVLDRLDAPVLSDEDVAAPPDCPEPTWPGVAGIVAAAAIRAPSASNAQPWQIEAGSDTIAIRLAREHTSTLDVGHRASAVALGAAVFNAKVAAAAHEALGPVRFEEDANGSLLQATLQLGHGADPNLAGLYEAVLAREANRRLGTPQPLADDTVQLLHAAAELEGARLHLMTEPDEIGRAATILADSDRARYLTPKLHAEMIAELRWPGDPDPDTGIDIRSLEFEPSDLAVVGILRRPDVMANLARWKAGSALGESTGRLVSASSALAVISVPGGSLTDYACGGAAAEAVWVTAQLRGLAVQPVSPIFLYARGRDDLAAVSIGFADELRSMQQDLGQLVGLTSDAAIALLLRFAVSAPASVRSKRDLGRVYFQ
jgi:hypothetical protein